MAFIDTIKAKAKADKKTIVLPESMDKRTFEAAEKILKEGIANLVIIGTPEEIEKNGAGYDHCFVLNKKEEGELSFAARIKEPVSGRTMEVYTTEPGVQVYSDNWADGYKGQNGATFPRRSAICFEAQHFPDSPNHPYFPSVVLNPGEQYTQKTVYKFGVEK